MSLLGNAARLVVTSSNPNQSLYAWQAIGFEDDGSSDPVVRLTDGQVHVTLLPGTGVGFGLAYFAPSLQRVGDRLIAAGVAIEGSNSSQWRVPGPGHLEIWVHPATADTMNQRSGEASPFLGYFDALVVPVDDVQQAIAWAQNCGYIIIDTWKDPMPRADLTDGITTVSFRQQELRTPFLHYSADIDDEWIEDISSIDGLVCNLHNDSSGGIAVVTVEMPDGITIMVTQDELS